MNITALILILIIQKAVSYKCNDYDAYLKDTKNFIRQCSKQPSLSFKRDTPVIDAKKFDGDQFNVFFSKLRRFQVCIHVQNTKLKRLSFPAIRDRADARCPKALAAIVIRDNPDLEEIVFGNNNKVIAAAIPTLMVRGNRKLSNETITRLNELKVGARASKRNSIQVFGGFYWFISSIYPFVGAHSSYTFGFLRGMYGIHSSECSVPKPLTSLDDLIGCESLHGDILLKQTLPPPRQPLKPFTLTGCVIVKSSKVENIDFLGNLQRQLIPTWLCENEILDNPKLCIHEEMERILRARINNLNMTVREECEIVCMGGIVTPDYISTTIAGHHCAVIRGDLIVKNWTGNISALESLKSVRKIIGALHVVGNLQMKKLDFLSGLELMDMRAKDNDPAVIISGNPLLEEVQLISLKTVNSKALTTVVIQNNPRLSIDVEEWYEIAGGENRTVLVLAELKEDKSGDITPLLLKIAAAFILVMILALIVYWCGWGTRWESFSGMLASAATTSKSKGRNNQR